MSYDCINPSSPKPENLFAKRNPSAPTLNKIIGKYSRRVFSPVLDSGSTSHHNNRRDRFVSLKPVANSAVSLADGSTCKIRGVGNVRLQTGRKQLELKDVKFTPEFDTNLVSVSQLTKDGCTVVFEEKQATVLKDGEVAC